MHIVWTCLRYLHFALPVGKAKLSNDIVLFFIKSVCLKISILKYLAVLLFKTKTKQHREICIIKL